MKRLILFVSIAFLFTSCDSLLSPESETSKNNTVSSQNEETQQQEWQSQDINTESILSSVYFLDDQTGWAVGTDGIFYTNNGGENWHEQEGISDEVNSVFFVDNQNGWAAGDSTILHTNDGGESWQKQCRTSQNLNDIYFADTQQGWAVSDSAVILHTDNGGETWYRQFESEDFGPTSTFGAFPGFLNGVHFIDEQTGWAIGGRSTTSGPPRTFVVHTTDGGETWESEYSDSGMAWISTDIHFTDQDHGWVTSRIPYIEEGVADYPISVTEDGGQTWNTETVSTDLETPPMISSIHFVDTEQGWMVGESGIILHSTDGGVNWEQQESGIPEDIPADDQFLNDVYFVDENNGWAVGDNGRILHYSNTEE